MTRSKSNPQGFWSDRKKIEVVTTYLALGKAPMVEAVTGVPQQTIRIWKMQPLWKELEEEIRREENLELDSRLGKIVDKSLEVVMDRLENGDFTLNSKTGKVSRIPVKLRDATMASNALIDKRQLIRKNPIEKAQHQQQFEDRLLKLAEQFAEFAIGKKKNEKVIEGEVIDAIPNQWEEGLQTRVVLGTQEEAQSGEGSSISEQGEEYDGIEGGEECSDGEGCGAQEGYIKGWPIDDVQPDGSEQEGQPLFQPQ